MLSRIVIFRTFVPSPVRLVPVVLALIASAAPAEATVTLDSQRRVVQTFATIDYYNGEDQQSQDFFESLDPGVFDQSANCQVGSPGDQATSSAGQLSYITTDILIAEGSMQAQAEVGELASFAEAFGESRFTSIFSVDEPTEVRLLATLIASGNGRVNLILRIVGGSILVYRSLFDTQESLDETHILSPGSYELTAQANGFGQAFEGGGEPAFSGFSISLDFPATAAVTPGTPGVDAMLPVVAPNPIHGEARILLPARVGDAGSGAPAVVVVDLGGRVVRRFDEVGPSGVLWDTRDNEGRLVPAGLYLIRSGAGATSRAIVLR